MLFTGQEAENLEDLESLLGFSRIPWFKKSRWNECKIIGDWIRLFNSLSDLELLWADVERIKLNKHK